MPHAAARVALKCAPQLGVVAREKRQAAAPLDLFCYVAFVFRVVVIVVLEWFASGCEERQSAVEEGQRLAGPAARAARASGRRHGQCAVLFVCCLLAVGVAACAPGARASRARPRCRRASPCRGRARRARRGSWLCDRRSLLGVGLAGGAIGCWILVVGRCRPSRRGGGGGARRARSPPDAGLQAARPPPLIPPPLSCARGRGSRTAASRARASRRRRRARAQTSTWGSGAA